MAAARKKSKILVILSDGTSNEIESERTNVLRLFQCVDTTKTDVVFYDPGVGTVGAYSNWSRWWIKLKEILGLAFGKGLDDNVLDAYHFLIRNWEKGDKIYLFGFSRGAYTVRVLAGLVYTLGILKPEQENLSRYALNTLKEASLDQSFTKLGIYQETLNRQPVEIEFLGVWDSVSSVFLWIKGMFRIKNIGYTRRNHAIKSVRHALAIDERRRFFVQYDWKPDQNFTTHLPNEPEYYNGVFPPQDVKEVWFAGVHGDAGGGYDDADSKVPKIALEWMLAEARKKGLPIDTEKLAIILGYKTEEGKDPLSKPDPTAPIHNSLSWAWWILEYFPKWRKGKEFSWLDPTTWFSFYIPLGERRRLYNVNDEEAVNKVKVHESVKTRREKTDYSPPNLPDDSQIEWITTENWQTKKPAKARSRRKS